MGPPLWTASAIYLYIHVVVCAVYIFHIRSVHVGLSVSFFSSTSVLQAESRKSVAGERMQHDCSSRGAWLREGRRMRERRRRCPLPTCHDGGINNEQRSSSCSYVC